MGLGKSVVGYESRLRLFDEKVTGNVLTSIIRYAIILEFITYAEMITVGNRGNVGQHLGFVHSQAFYGIQKRFTEELGINP